jgi:hypothetical protein
MLCIVVGAFIIVVRAPMVFAPSAALRFFSWLVSTDARIRGLALVIAPLALALIVLTRAQGAVAGALHVLGWGFAAATLWLLAAPGSYRLVARGVLDFMESSIDMAIVRMLGLVAVSIGVALIYVGIYVV